MDKRASSKGACSDHPMSSDDLAFEMNGADLMLPQNDYSDSLHYKINQNMKNQAKILNRYSGAHSNVYECPIKFGETKLEDYQ